MSFFRPQLDIHSGNQLDEVFMSKGTDMYVHPSCKSLSSEEPTEA